MKKLILIFSLCAISAFSGGCQTLQKVESALTGSNAVLTLEVAGATVDFAMHTADSMLIRKEITLAQWQTVAVIHDKFILAYNVAVKNVIAANTPAPATVGDLMKQIVSTVSALNSKSATAT